MYKKIVKCRVCGNTNLATIFDLGEQYLTGVFPSKNDEFDLKGPVTLVKCVGENTCGLVQLEQSYDLELMYGDNYGYRSGLNSSMAKHLEGKISKIEKNFNIKNGDIVLDIGANDGTSLKAYENKNITRVAVDPTIKKFAKYYPVDIKQIADFFPSEDLNQYLGKKKCKIITSFSMFYDLEDPIKFAKMIAKYLHNDGVWVFEQSYLPTMLKANSFDTICHEHLEFYSIKQIDWILDFAGLKIVDVELNEINGGSISVTAALKSFTNDEISRLERVNKIRLHETKAGIDEIEIWDTFRKRVDLEKNRLIDLINRTKINGGKVYGLGASTKGNVLLQYYNLNKLDIEAIFEVNEDKYNCVTPGGQIPILPESKLEVVYDEKDILIVLPWHFKNFFLNKNIFNRYNLVFPLPIVNERPSV